MNKIFNSIFLSIILIVAITGCQKETDFDPKFPSEDFISDGLYGGEYWPTLGWRTCSPEQAGMDSEKLKKLNEEITLLLKLHIDVHGVLVISKGYIVAEQYYSNDFNADSLHRIYSCTKSITSSAIGIAINEGYIENINQPVLEYFTGFDIENPNPLKETMTIRHFLTMSAGLEWKEMDYPYDDERNTYNQWIQSDDPVSFVLNRPLIHVPGEEYDYSTGYSHVLSAIIERSTGIKLDQFVNEKIFLPLGVQHYYWPKDINGIPYGGNGVRLMPRDMAKIGYLYLRKGRWENKQIVPEEWVLESSQNHIQMKYITDYYYGYHWWVHPDGRYAAVGYAGQWIFVIPEHDLVVVFINNFDESDSWQLTTPERLLQTYIIPAVKD